MKVNYSASIKYIKSCIKRQLPRQRILGLYKGSSPPIGRALLSYVSSAFCHNPSSPAFRSHANQRRSRAIVHALNLHGYVVDVIDHDDDKYETDNTYDLIIGIERSLDYSKKYLNHAGHKIYLATGLHWMSQNALSYQRALAILQRRGCALVPERLAPVYHSPEKCDIIISVQNNYTNQSYAYLRKPIYTVRSSVPIYKEGKQELLNKACARGCLWLSGGGFVLKGLDLVLEAAALAPECPLYVCAYLDKDPAFKNMYSRELYNTPNIKAVGWQDIGNKEFKAIIENCRMTIYPYPEAEISSSLLNAMYLGMIPILNGYDSNGVLNGCAVTVDATVESISNVMRTVSELPEAQVSRMSNMAQTIAQTFYSPDAEQLEWNDVLRRIIDALSLPVIGKKLEL